MSVFIEKMRKAKIKRETTETNIELEINLDGTGTFEIDVGLNFFNHMLSLLSKHSMIDLKIKAVGDLEHHIIEDVGIALGEGLKKALGKKTGIRRFGFSIIPMDEALARCSIDLSGRIFHIIDLSCKKNEIEDVQVEDLIHFLKTLSKSAEFNLHLHVMYGENEHHKVEAAFKALGKSLHEAVKIISTDIPSTKGIL